MNSPKLSYRAEIDGLRAIAVISVILYHAQIAVFAKDWFDGGFIGVDIFFVISGYLITRIILVELYVKGSFSFINFYERRARRILPMLIVVMLASVPYAWQKLLPLDFVEYAESILASLLFSSNFFFYFSTTEYGADSALLKPFLHTWSLGVEEQFYLFFPLLAIVAFKFFRAHFLAVLVALTLMSLHFSELMGIRNSELNFYLPFSRFWELAVGSILAYRELNYKTAYNEVEKHVFPIIGLYLVVYSLLNYDVKAPHPSFNTIIPIIGVALIIGYSSKDELVGKILGCKPFVWIGLVSYSAYLWHFPIFAFSRIGGGKLTSYDKMELILVTFLLSILSYWIVEKPFRNSLNRQYFFSVIIFSVSLLIASSLYIIGAEGFNTQKRVGFDPKILATAQPSYLYGDKGCEKQDALYINESQFCLFGDVHKAKLDFLLLGDSHAMHSQPLLDKIGYQRGLKGAFGGSSGCPPLLGVYPLRGNPHPNGLSKKCFGFNQNGFELVKSQSIKTVFLVARWDYYVDGANKGVLNNISDTTLEFGDIELTRQIYKDGVLKTFEAYRDLGVKVIVVLQVPHQNENVKRVLEGVIDSTETKDKMFAEALKRGVELTEHRKRQQVASSSWLDLSEKFSSDQLIIIDPTEEFCNSERCPFVNQKFAFYTDYDHASELGYGRLEGKFLSSLGIYDN